MFGQPSTGPREWPRLVYISDVPVESYMHGSLLLYRLLRRYPVERLRILEVLANSRPERRLPGVRYSSTGRAFARMRTTRFGSFVDRVVMPPVVSISWPLDLFWPRFQPEAVLSVGHGVGCLVAAQYARRKTLPLHLVAHDDVRRFLAEGNAGNSAEQKFASAYRYASSRLCVSPRLERVYRERYGASGSVLYPASGDDTPRFDTPSAGPGQTEPFTVAFAGNVFYRGQLQLIVTVGELLRRLGGKLLLFGPHDRSRMEAAGMDMSVAVLRGTLQSVDLIKAMRSEAHALLLPWTFEQAEIEELSVSFPSKLTDYMATGLPILAWGPADNPVDTWLKEVPGTMVNITSQAPEPVLEALKALARDELWRLELGRNALEAGKRYFSPDVAARLFEAALAG